MIPQLLALKPIDRCLCFELFPVANVGVAGDFDIDAIENVTPGKFTLLLFLGYLFFCVFILLSMFLAILAEAQSAVREAEDSGVG